VDGGEEGRVFFYCELHAGGRKRESSTFPLEVRLIGWRERGGTRRADCAEVREKRRVVHPFCEEEKREVLGLDLVARNVGGGGGLGIESIRRCAERKRVFPLAKRGGDDPTTPRWKQAIGKEPRLTRGKKVTSVDEKERRPVF